MHITLQKRFYKKWDFAQCETCSRPDVITSRERIAKTPMQAGSVGAAGATGLFGVFQRVASVAVRVTCGFIRGFRCATSPAL